MIDYSLILTINHPGKEWSLVGNSYESLDWRDSSKKPSKDELDALWASTKASIDANAYKAKRAAAYPPVTDYLDGIVKNDKAQIDKYVADCLAVKAKYPKSS